MSIKSSREIISSMEQYLPYITGYTDFMGISGLIKMVAGFFKLYIFGYTIMYIILLISDVLLLIRIIKEPVLNVLKETKITENIINAKNGSGNNENENKDNNNDSFN